MTEQQLQDRLIKCRDCACDFRYSVRDQEFFKKMDFKEPKRCKPCRDLLKGSNISSN